MDYQNNQMMPPSDNQSTVDQIFNVPIEEQGGTPINQIKKPQFEQPQQHPQTQPKERPRPPMKRKKQQNKIKDLVKDINTSIKPKKYITLSDSSDISLLSDDGTNITSNESNDIFSSGFSIVKEALLIVIIYVILSQGFVKRTIGKYIPQVLASEDQTTSMIGHLIYGGLLAIITISFKKFLEKI
jgi:hypothetical protein